MDSRQSKHFTGSSECLLHISNRPPLLKLNNTIIGLRIDVLPNMLEPRLGGQRDQCRQCPFLRRHRRHHTHVLAGFEVRRTCFTENDAVDQQSGVARPHRFSHDLQDLDALGVRPVVENGAVVIESST